MKQTMMNKFFKYFSLKSLAIITFSLLVFSCGGSDDDNNGYNAPEDDSTEMPAQLIGTWNITGQQQDGNIIKLIFQFDAGGTGKIVEYNYSYTSSTFEEQSNASFTYTFDASTASLVITDNSGSVTFHVDELTSQNLTLSDASGNKYMFSSGWGISSVSTDEGYAPADATDLNIKVGLGKWGSFDGYFQSNTSVNTTYSKWVFVDSHSITSARYTKTGPNTAEITFSYASTSNFKGDTKTIELSFTSSTGGTATSGNLASGTFTVEKFSKTEDIVAPYDLSGLRLSVPHAGENYYVFGEGVSNYYPIKQHKGSTTFGTLSASYNRISDTRAVITIKDRTEYSTRECTYTLDFYTSTSGKYSYYNNVGSYGTYTWTGDFTLK